MTRVFMSFSHKLRLDSRHADCKNLDVTIEGVFDLDQLSNLIDQLTFGAIPKFGCVRINIANVSPWNVQLIVLLGRVARLGEECILTDGRSVWEYPIDCSHFAEDLTRRLAIAKAA